MLKKSYFPIGLLLIVTLILAACTVVPKIIESQRKTREDILTATRSEAVFPQQEVPFRFFHNKHTDLSIDCLFCHRDIPNSTKSSDNNLPKKHTLDEPGENVCQFCHLFFAKRGRKYIPAECDTCHVGFDKDKDKTPKPIVIPKPNLIFNHKKHIDNKIECLRCHVGIDKVELATRENIPNMNKCLECHDGRTVVNNVVPPEDCTTCHIADKTGLLQTSFPTGDLKPGPRRPFYHDRLWVRNHRKMAEADKGLCENCHRDDFCLNCHRGGFTERGGFAKPSSIHPQDWIALHPKDAYTNSVNCTSCHRLDSFCRDCHGRLKVRIDKFPQGRSFHIPRWAAFVVTPEHHSHFAKRNIQTCRACHQENDCKQCHMTIKKRREIGLRPGAQVNPHPTNFDRRGRIKRKNEKVCLKCHVRGDF